MKQVSDGGAGPFEPVALPVVMQDSPAMERAVAQESAIVAAQGRAEIEAAYVMAAHRPRKQSNARVMMLEACKRPAFARKAIYSKPQGRSRVEGLSIRAAEEALRAWGNVRVATVVTLETETVRKIRVTCTDLESNLSFGGEFTLAKTVERKSAEDREVIGQRTNTQGQRVFIVAATEDELVVKQASAVSKAIRTSGLRLIPSDMQEEMTETARATMANADAVDPKAARKEIEDGFFFQLRVPPAELAEYIGHSLDTCAPAEMQGLREVYAAIRDGQENWPAILEARREARRVEKEEREATGPQTVRKPLPDAKEPPTGGDAGGEPGAQGDAVKRAEEAAQRQPSGRAGDAPDTLPGMNGGTPPQDAPDGRRQRRSSLS